LIPTSSEIQNNTGFLEDVFSALPDPVKLAASRAYKLFLQDPNHPGLEFKPVKGTRQPVYSVRIGIGYRAIGVMTQGEIVWYWIGSHADYDKLIP